MAYWVNLSDVTPSKLSEKTRSEASKSKYSADGLSAKARSCLFFISAHNIIQQRNENILKKRIYNQLM
jgi:hypothetical protein